MERIMIVLHQFPRSWGIPNLSQFCVKIETYLRLANLPYQIVESMPLKGPRGKLPFIEDQDKKISDSRLIVDYLKTAYGDPLDSWFSPTEKGIAMAFQRLLEEHLYWVGMMTRWDYTEQNWQTNKQAIFGGLPPIARDLIAALYRHRINGQILGHGLGRLSADEAFLLGCEDIDALAAFLADKPYFMGIRPCSLDATAYGILVNTLGCPIESPLKDYALAQTNLVDYCQRMQAECFPELPWSTNVAQSELSCASSDEAFREAV
jgi:glutathione S-transferase